MLAQVLRIQKSMQAAIYSPASSVDRAAAQAAKKAIRTYVQPSIVTDFGIVNNCIGLIGFFTHSILLAGILVNVPLDVPCRVP